jgi:hypothetical protein
MSAPGVIFAHRELVYARRGRRRVSAFTTACTACLVAIEPARRVCVVVAIGNL